MEDIGIDDFIAKPVDIGILLQRIHDKLQLNWITSTQEQIAAQAPASEQQVTSPLPEVRPASFPTPATNAERTVPETPVATEPQGGDNQSNVGGLPDADALKALHELGAMGYVRGILEKLDELEQLRPDLAEMVHQLRTPVQQFHLGEYMRLLKQLEAKHEHT